MKHSRKFASVSGSVRPAASRGGSTRAQQGNDDGFTLVELLVVIVILGILSAVVVFAVRGAGDKGKGAALATDERTIRTAEEAFCAQKGRYAEMGDATMPGTLVGDKFLSEPSKYHSVKLDTTGGPCGSTKFEIKCSDGTQQMPDCGLSGNPTTSGGNWFTQPPADLPVNSPYYNRMFKLADGRILHSGAKEYPTGGGGPGFPEGHIYDPASRTWATTTGFVGGLDVVVIPGISTPACINCGKILTINYVGTQTAQYTLFDPATSTSTVVPQSPSGCGFGRSLTVLPDNTVLAAGCAGYDQDAQSRADLFDPTALTSPWTALPNMQNQRERPVTVRLADGKVLVVGGGGGGTPTGSTVISGPDGQAETYDPITKKWGLAGHPGRDFLDNERGGLGGILLRNGRAFFMSGNRAVVWDPAGGGSWSSVPGECACGGGHAKSILPSGKVLAVGGSAYSDELGYRRFNSASLFDPDLNAWTPAAPIPGPGREDIGAILLEGSTCAAKPDDCGKVLVAGGHDYDSTDSAGKPTFLFSESG